MKAAKFDRKSDAGKSVIRELDLSNAQRPGLRAKRINVNFPAWMVDSIDRQARRLGTTRQALIRLWLAEKLRQRQHTAPAGAQLERAPS